MWNKLEEIPVLKKGGIHIKKKNRGKFTESANRSGMGVQEFANHVLANKDKYSTTQTKRAAFAKGIGGSQKKKHENGGSLKAQEGKLLTRINQSSANFISRLKDSLRSVIPD
jgi:Zn-dependent oligopeptidase